MTASTPTLAPTEPPTAPTLDADDHGGRFTPELAGWFRPLFSAPDTLTLLCTEAQFTRLVLTGVIDPDYGTPKAPGKHLLGMPLRIDVDGHAVCLLAIAPLRPMVRAIAARLTPETSDYCCSEPEWHRLDGERTRAWMEAQS